MVLLLADLVDVAKPTLSHFLDACLIDIHCDFEVEIAQEMEFDKVHF